MLARCRERLQTMGELTRGLRVARTAWLPKRRRRSQQLTLASGSEFWNPLRDRQQSLGGEAGARSLDLDNQGKRLAIVQAVLALANIPYLLPDTRPSHQAIESCRPSAESNGIGARLNPRIVRARKGHAVRFRRRQLINAGRVRPPFRRAVRLPRRPPSTRHARSMRRRARPRTWPCADKLM